MDKRFIYEFLKPSNREEGPTSYLEIPKSGEKDHVVFRDFRNNEVTFVEHPNYEGYTIRSNHTAQSPELVFGIRHVEPEPKNNWEYKKIILMSDSVEKIFQMIDDPEESDIFDSHNIDVKFYTDANRSEAVVGRQLFMAKARFTNASVLKNTNKEYLLRQFFTEPRKPNPEMVGDHDGSLFESLMEELFGYNAYTRLFEGPNTFKFVRSAMMDTAKNKKLSFVPTRPVVRQRLDGLIKDKTVFLLNTDMHLDPSKDMDQRADGFVNPEAALLWMAGYKSEFGSEGSHHLKGSSELVKTEQTNTPRRAMSSNKLSHRPESWLVKILNNDSMIIIPVKYRLFINVKENIPVHLVTNKPILVEGLSNEDERDVQRCDKDNWIASRDVVNSILQCKCQFISLNLALELMK